MENELKQKKNTGLYAIIGILCVMVLALGGYFVYKEYIEKDKEEPSINDTTDKTDKKDTATETEKMNYGKHMLQYQHNDELYFIILNRQYIDVFLNDELFMEYEYDQLDNILSPFFDNLNN